MRPVTCLSCARDVVVLVRCCLPFVRGMRAAVPSVVLSLALVRLDVTLSALSSYMYRQTCSFWFVLLLCSFRLGHGRPRLWKFTAILIRGDVYADGPSRGRSCGLARAFYGAHT